MEYVLSSSWMNGTYNITFISLTDAQCKKGKKIIKEDEVLLDYESQNFTYDSS